jgi:predicted ATP-grasp superfamily ATP-dependent carboligase
MRARKENNHMAEKSTAVISPVDDHMGLDIARILAPRGISVFGIDHNYDIPGRFSKYIKYIYSPYSDKDEKAFIEFLLRFGESLGQKAVLYPLSDDHVFLFSNYRNELNKYYAFLIPDHQLVEKLINKDGLYYLACKYSIPAPKTFFVNNKSSLDLISSEIIFPAIIKPEESSFWYSERASQILVKGLFSGRPKVVYCRNWKELINNYERISKIDNRVVIQEVIPGKDNNLVYVAFYCNRDSEILGYFSGKKHRVIPKGFGSASYVKSFDDLNLRPVVTKFLKDIGYKGLGGIEFKKDIRDGVYKIIEFNPRFGMWDGLGAHCGVNLPYIAYCDAKEIPVKRQLKFREEVIWVDWQRDIRAFLEYRNAGQLNFWQWVKSLRGEKVFPIYSCSDWKPGAYFTISLFNKLWHRLLREVKLI